MYNRPFRALGQGAFGEVYEGCYKFSAGDTVETAVAVKTLPELQSNQGLSAERKFAAVTTFLWFHGWHFGTLLFECSAIFANAAR